jgi:hypothetical protein
LRDPLTYFSATIEVNIGKKHYIRLREVIRARDEFLNLFYGDSFDAEAENIDHYFMNFSYLTRRLT